MRLFYRWFCRVIGVGSVLDMVNLYVWTMIWILGVFIIFLPDYVDSRKHRSSHRHGHHRHHHHHRKHPTLRQQLPRAGNFSAETSKSPQDFSSKNFNVTNIVNTATWLPSEASALLFFNSSSFADNQQIVTLYRNENSTFVPNFGETSNGLKNSSIFDDCTERNINLESSVSFSNCSSTSIVSTDLSITNSYNQNSEAIKTDGSIDSASLSTSFNITEIEQEQVAEDLEKLFGSAEDRKRDAVAAIETPVVRLIRKKRSLAGEEEEEDDGKMRKATLLDFTGPAISNDPEEMGEAFHVRVKRDGSQSNDDRSAALSSLDSAYLRNLEDSFALSALEVQAQRSGRAEREISQSNEDSSANIARVKRDTELSVREENTKNVALEPLKSVPFDSVSEDDDYTSKNRVNALEHLENSQLSLDSGYQEDNNKKLAADSRFTPADSIATSVNSVLRNVVNDREDLKDVFVTANVGQAGYTNYLAAGSGASNAADFSAKSANSVLHNRVNEVEHLENNADQENSTNKIAAVSRTSTSTNLLGSNVNPVSHNRVKDVELRAENLQTLDLDSTNDFSAESSTSTQANSATNYVNPISEHRVNAELTANSPSNLIDVTNDSVIVSRTSTELLSKVDDPVLEKRVNYVVPSMDNSSSERNRGDEDASRGQSSIEDVAARPQRSPADNSVLKDDNSISRYGLDDVYPDIIQDPENPSRMAQLVRTKRFGDSIVYREAADASYANELDKSRAADEPYEEDNRIIDSMLSKVDYRSADERERSARSENEGPFNEEEIDGRRTGEVTAIRGKRGKFAKRTRKKTGGRRGHRKRKKGRKRRPKKKHRPKRPKNKRVSRDLSKREFGFANSLPDTQQYDSGGRLSDNEEDAISPHDGRRRRENEDEDDENFNSDTNETAGRVRRDIRRIYEEDIKGESMSPNDAALTKARREAKSRDKRNSPLRDVKNVKNSREADVAQNGSQKIVDKQVLRAEAAGSVMDIRQLVAQLLVKVDELYSYIVEGSGNEDQSKNPQTSGTLSNTSNVDQAAVVPLKILRLTTNTPSVDVNAAPRQANAVKEPEACWKRPSTWNREAPKNNRPARNLRGQRCGKNSRRKRKSQRKWDRWTDWSSCSVTCGRGRQIRWRHCVHNCSIAETEMEEKACQLPACAPGKFLGIFG